MGLCLLQPPTERKREGLREKAQVRCSMVEKKEVGDDDDEDDAKDGDGDEAGKRW